MLSLITSKPSTSIPKAFFTPWANALSVLLGYLLLMEPGKKGMNIDEVCMPWCDRVLISSRTE